MIVVEAAPDPVQKKLRTDKKLWNKEVSSFIDNVLNLKKMMNGQPSKFFKQKGSIKDPIPMDPISIIGTLAGDFQELAQKGNTIVQQQLDYSKNRKKKQPKQKKVEQPIATPAPVPMAPPTGTPTEPVDLTKQLAAALEAYELLAIGSNPMSRFFARLMNPAIGSSSKSRIRKYRMSMLKSALDIFKDLGKLQETIMGSSPESIFEASRLLSKIENSWNFFKTGLKTYKGSDGKSTTEGGKITLSDSKVEDIIKDYRENAKSLGATKKNKFISSIIRYKKIVESGSKTSDIAGLSDVVDSIVEEYNKILLELNLKHGTDGGSLREILAKVSVGKPTVAVPPPSKTVIPTAQIPGVKLSPVLTPEDVLRDYKKFGANFTGIDIKKLLSLFGDYRLTKNPSLAPQIMAEYSNILSALNSKHGTNGSSLQEIWETKKKRAKASTDHLEVVAQQSLQKWLGKLKHQINPFDKTSAHRLDIYKIAATCRKELNKIMDSLEDAMNVEALEALVAEVDKSLKEIQFLSSGLESTIHGKGFDQPFIDLLERGKLTQYSPDLDPKQREHLKKMIEQRRLRELTNLYQGKK